MTSWKELKNKPFLWKKFESRQKIIKKTRTFFARKGFLEVQTPILSPSLIPESYLEIFKTTVSDKNGKKQNGYLSPSPEIWHKKLLAAGAEKIFEITKSFRDTDIGGHFHNPEFTMAEWYRAGKESYRQIIDDCQQLIRFAAGSDSIKYQGAVLNIDKPFEKITVADAFDKYAGIDKKSFFNVDKLKAAAKKSAIKINDNDDWETVYNLVYLQKVEPNLGMKKPTVIYDFPHQFAPMAKADKNNPLFKKRFEVYLFGVELADGYNELTDYKKQLLEFKRETKKRLLLRRKSHLVDLDFIRALKSGLPECSGVAMGMDRLIMVLTDSPTIDEVILFSGKEIFKKLR